MTELTQGQKSSAVRAWNKHRDLAKVAEVTKVDVEAVRTFLASYADYPGEIYSTRAFYKFGGKPVPKGGGRRPAPSLPRFSFEKED